MKNLFLILPGCLCAAPALTAQTTAFTYQGRLNHGGSAANGLYEMSFAFYDAPTHGSVVGLPVTVAPVPVSNGLFTASLDFGAGVHFEDGFEDRGSTASGRWSGVLGGADNVAGGLFSVVAGGEANRARGNYGTIPGGLDCEASGELSFAAGWGAHALHDGSFVWSGFGPPLGGPHFESTTNNQFSARAAGGVRFFTDLAATTGAELAPGSGTWSSLSDRHAKENFATADAREILDKVAALPLASWNYQAQDKSVRHLGPMAQDFHAAFGLGESDRTITTVDADGVALAAIQGLNRKMEEKEARIQTLERELAALKELVASLAGTRN